MILADAAAGTAAIITAIGGLVVSLSSVWFNSRKQSNATSENTGYISVLTDQIADLATEVATLKAENVALRTEIRILKEQRG